MNGHRNIFKHMFAHRGRSKTAQPLRRVTPFTGPTELSDAELAQVAGGPAAFFPPEMIEYRLRFMSQASLGAGFS